MTLNEFIDEIDPETVCEEYGIEIKKRGSKIQILCPFHDDTHFGSAVLTRHGMHCFACGESHNIVEMIAQANNMPYIEYRDKMTVAKDIATKCYPALYSSLCKSNKKAKPQDDFFLSRKDLRMLGLYTANDGYSKLKELYSEDAYAFLDMVTNKLLELMCTYTIISQEKESIMTIFPYNGVKLIEYAINRLSDLNKIKEKIELNSTN